VTKLFTHIARIFIVVMILTTVMSTLAMANGWRGRGRDKKYGRFINRHDGRYGRFDGRGRRDHRYDRWYGGRWDRGRSRWGWDRHRFDRRYYYRDRRFNRRFW
jgi:hypothetical protein